MHKDWCVFVCCALPHNGATLMAWASVVRQSLLSVRQFFLEIVKRITAKFVELFQLTRLDILFKISFCRRFFFT